VFPKGVGFNWVCNAMAACEHYTRERDGGCPRFPANGRQSGGDQERKIGTRVSARPIHAPRFARARQMWRG
jgi:hypothetical protein